MTSGSIRLYSYWRSSAAYRVRIGLNLKGLVYETVPVHLVRDELDAGPILGQAVVPVLAGDSPDSLAARVVAMEHRLYPAALAAYASGALRVEGERVLGQPVALFPDPA